MFSSGSSSKKPSTSFRPYDNSPGWRGGESPAAGYPENTDLGYGSRMLHADGAASAAAWGPAASVSSSRAGSRAPSTRVPTTYTMLAINAGDDDGASSVSSAGGSMVSRSTRMPAVVSFIEKIAPAAGVMGGLSASAPVSRVSSPSPAARGPSRAPPYRVPPSRVAAARMDATPAIGAAVSVDVATAAVVGVPSRTQPARTVTGGAAAGIDPAASPPVPALADGPMALPAAPVVEQANIAEAPSDEQNMMGEPVSARLDTLMQTLNEKIGHRMTESCLQISGAMEDAVHCLLPFVERVVQALKTRTMKLSECQQRLGLCKLQVRGLEEKCENLYRDNHDMRAQLVLARDNAKLSDDKVHTLQAENQALLARVAVLEAEAAKTHRFDPNAALKVLGSVLQQRLAVPEILEEFQRQVLNQVDQEDVKSRGISESSFDPDPPGDLPPVGSGKGPDPDVKKVLKPGPPEQAKRVAGEVLGLLQAESEVLSLFTQALLTSEKKDELQTELPNIILEIHETWRELDGGVESFEISSKFYFPILCSVDMSPVPFKKDDFEIYLKDNSKFAAQVIPDGDPLTYFEKFKETKFDVKSDEFFDLVNQAYLKWETPVSKRVVGMFKGSTMPPGPAGAK